MKLGNIRHFLVGLCTFVFFIWGPDPSYLGVPSWVIHLISTALVLIVAWGALKYVWRKWMPDGADEARLASTVAGALAGALFFGAVLALQADSHEECTREIRTRDGTECVGDYVTVSGPDLGAAFLLAFGGALALWYSFRKPEPKPPPDIN